MTHSLSRFSLLVTLVLAGCVDPGDDETTAPDGDAEPVYTETVAHVVDGQLVVDAERPLPLSQELADNDRKARVAAGEPIPFATVDPGCAPTSFWLYDQPYFTGNRICFAGDLEVHLWEILKPIRVGRTVIGWTTWELSRGSEWAGQAYALNAVQYPDNRPNADPPTMSPYTTMPIFSYPDGGKVVLLAFWIVP